MMAARAARARPGAMQQVLDRTTAHGLSPPLRPARQAETARAPLLLLSYLRQHRFRLRQPEGHVHGTVQGNGGG
jgi:hypothetical protein